MKINNDLTDGMIEYARALREVRAEQSEGVADIRVTLQEATEHHMIETHYKETHPTYVVQSIQEIDTGYQCDFLNTEATANGEYEYCRAYITREINKLVYGEPFVMASMGPMTEFESDGSVMVEQLWQRYMLDKLQK